MTTQEQITLDAIDALNAKCIDPGANNEVMLSVDIQVLNRAKNGGYPREMYHATMAPRLALNRIQESNLAEAGYRRNYILQSYPKWLHRRNLDPKMEPAGFMESRLVKTEAEHAALLKQRVPATCEQWVTDAAQLSELPEAQIEHPSVTIARLQGKIEAMESGDGPATKKSK